MANNIYYIDPTGGNDSNSGLSATQPIKTYNVNLYSAGDTILFKRGSIIRDMLETCDGSLDGYTTYGAYGTGENPVFLGSEPADDTEKWLEERPSVWRYTGTFSSEVCNLIFNGTSCGNLRWQLEGLAHQGEWYYTQIGLYSEYENTDFVIDNTKGILYLYSSINPGSYYTSIECALWGKRKLVGGRSHIILENLTFQNSGVHGYQEIRAEHIKIRNCEFKFIGGAVWSGERRIRFGNAIELWDGARDIAVENCVFSNIYDSGVTHQGGDSSENPEELYFRNNLFVGCGMAAYECRGPAAREVYFEYNTCVNAGGGFAMQGESPPRQSEIYPQPMGHHIFIWRIGRNTQKGHIFIRNNIFHEAPYGAALYSTIDPIDEAQFIIDNNCYCQTRGTLLALMKGQLFESHEFDRYKDETGQDSHGIFADPVFINEAAGDFRLGKGSPCPAAGKQ